MPARRKRKSKTTAPACIFFTTAKNEKGKNQICVMGECLYGGTRIGPIWSHTRAAVTKCLTLMTQTCDCGRVYHKQRRTEGFRIVTKVSSA